MLTVKEKGLLLNIIKHCNKINEKSTGLTRELLNLDEDTTQIICFNILQIGELVKSFDRNFLINYKEVPWNKIKGMRDKVAHGYGTLDLDMIWDTTINDIKPLLDYCKRIINEK